MSKVESVARGYAWISRLIQRGIKTVEDKKHRAWRKEYYGRQERERRAKRLARAGKGPIIKR